MSTSQSAGRSSPTSCTRLRSRPSACLDTEVEGLGIGAADLEVTLVEPPRYDWAIRGSAGDDLELGYQVEQ
ncbi:tautomerase family protein [Cellulomonas bogoriensis]|uniref:4-oxalocrotonate tautomerase n=1 Tax=Cellulomonas bogoriensis 69B4 = DSM 16987 TaxID=1386082 RepID=A0A0A0BYE0_9CELL|nr:hypothetical protein [Cellulomonas bogoriensis]KGM13413.1 4-oxalocrotonate tautomerase [Cellulomonas bogoriensis 69B4 = DSM 16987]